MNERLKKFLLEYSVTVPERKNTLDIDRKDMPQVKKDDMAHFLKYLEKNDIYTEKKEVDPKKLKATQGHFHKEKIRGMMKSIEDGELKKSPILVSKDNYIMDGHHRWLAMMNLDRDITILQVNLKCDELLSLMKEYPRSFTEKLYEVFELICESDQTCDIITPAHMKKFEKVVDQMFQKFNIDFNFTRHFADRMGDDRNKPCIKLKELADVIMKIYRKQGKSIKNIAGAEAVLKDIQTDLNIPVAVEYDRKADEFDVVMKTIMRKKDFKTPNKIIRY